MDEPQITADPEILALLGFEPVPRRFERDDGWSPALQRRFIANLALSGSPGKACEALGKRRSGIDKLAKLEGSESFRAAWARAVELAQERKAAEIEARHAGAPGIKLPFVDHRRKFRAALHQSAAVPLPGQMVNEFGEHEDEGSVFRRVEQARENICRKLLSARRHYLQEISGCPGKRAAFEILTGLPVDWEKAERFEEQADEPWRRPMARDADMVLTAESGWLFGEIGYGPDRKREMQEALNAYLVENGKKPIDWSAEGISTEAKTNDGGADALA